MSDETGEGWAEAAEQGVHVAAEAAYEVGTEALGVAEEVPGLGTVIGAFKAAPHVGEAIADSINGTPEQVHQDLGEAAAGMIGGLGGGLGYDLLAGLSRASGTDTEETAPWWGAGGEQGVADAIAYNLGGGTNPHSAAPAPLPEATQGPAPSRDDEIPPPAPPEEDPDTYTVPETVISADEAMGQ
jgi:hypothetical protein